MRIPNAALQSNNSPCTQVTAALKALPEVGDFTRLALWMAGALAGLSTTTHTLQRKHFRMMAKRLKWPVGKALGRPRPGMASAMPLLTDAMIGTSRAAIASVFGPPRCAMTDGEVVAEEAVWRGETWCYEIDNPAAQAVMITFTEDEVAGRVVFVGLS